jgi:hypothetical protein
MTVVSDLWRKNRRRQRAGHYGAFAAAHQKRLSGPHCLTRLGRMLKAVSIRLMQAAGLLSYPRRPALTFTVILFLHLTPQVVQAAEDDPVYCSSEGIITLSSQTAVDTFQTTYGPCDTTLYGIDIGTSSTIKNLAGLADLKTIQGDLNIQSTANLDDYTGLADLQVIEGDLSISRSGEAQPHQINMTSLVSIGGKLEIHGFYSSSRLTAAYFPVLESLGGALRIHQMASLTVLSFPALTTVPSLYLNAIELADLSGFAALTSITADLTISNNRVLRNLDGLASVTAIGGSLGMTSNASLVDLHGLAALSSITGPLVIQGNTALRACGGVFTVLNGSQVGGGTSIASNSAGL